MNKHTRKKYPHARREVTVYVDPPQLKERKTVSLFDETIARLARAEAELAEAHKRIASLEKALANSRAVNAQAIRMGFRDEPLNTPQQRDAPYGTRGRLQDLNSLSREEEEQLFHMHENEQWIDPNATPDPSPRPGIGARIRGVAALLTGKRNAVQEA